METAKDLRSNLRQSLNQYSSRLEATRERVEGVVRLHRLLGLEYKEKDVQLGVQKLTEKIGALNLIECNQNLSKSNSGAKIDKNSITSKDITENCTCWSSQSRFRSNHEAKTMADEDEDLSKIADSGLGGCDRCSCQSFDEPTSKSHNSDEMGEDCFENNLRGGIEYQISPLKPNAHLYSYSSNIALSDLDNSSGLAPKTQK